MGMFRTTFFYIYHLLLILLSTYIFHIQTYKDFIICFRLLEIRTKVFVSPSLITTGRHESQWRSADICLFVLSDWAELPSPAQSSPARAVIMITIQQLHLGPDFMLRFWHHSFQYLLCYWWTFNLAVSLGYIYSFSKIREAFKLQIKCKHIRLSIKV